jgi:hypothetical protein
MNLRQNPLLGDDDIPSPLFTPRPGWGGQLASWMRENSYLLVFRFVLAVSVALIVISLLRVRPQPSAPNASPTATALAAHQMVASRGDTLSSLAMRALDEHLSVHPEHTGLTPAHKLFITTTLARAAQSALSMNAAALEVGAAIPFPHAALEAVIAEAKHLTPSQLSAWARLLQ